MESLTRYLATPSRCGYLPERTWRLEYDLVAEATPEEYEQLLQQGWRRFGHAFFRPQCPTCNACRSVRVVVEHFRLNRSQRRVRQRNESEIRLQIGEPTVTRAKLALYDRYHAFQAEFKDWPAHLPKDADGYADSFVFNPFPAEEWCYSLDDRLVGVGYVDRLPQALSAIYFFYDPEERDRSLGTWNVLCMIARAAFLGLPYLYLGYFVEGCRSMEYKARYAPNQVLEQDRWREFKA